MAVKLRVGVSFPNGSSALMPMIQTRSSLSKRKGEELEVVVFLAIQWNSTNENRGRGRNIGRRERRIDSIFACVTRVNGALHIALLHCFSPLIPADTNRLAAQHNQPYHNCFNKREKN